MHEYSEIEKLFNNKINLTIKSLRKQLTYIRSNKISTALLQSIKVSINGSNVSINQIASLDIINTKELRITAWDKNNTKYIHQSIQKLNLGFGCQILNNNIKITVPPVSTETKISIIRQLNKISEENKISIRNTRKICMNYVNKLPRNRKISEDVKKRFNDKLQLNTNEKIKLITSIIKEKSSTIQ